MLLAVLGWVSSCVTTFVPLWKSLNLELNELEVWSMGLWQVCIAHEEGAAECRAHGSFLALPPALRVARLLMCFSDGLGLLGCALAAPGLRGWSCCHDKPALKRRLLRAGGAALGVAGMATLAPVSWVAYNTVLDFWDDTVPDIVPRWEFGEATFLGCTLRNPRVLILLLSGTKTERKAVKAAALAAQDPVTCEALLSTGNGASASP
ncbi:hypothetical protein Q9966_009098 [Columba livia]|nr:hypothetical protein Q9966_009098 [Columba livia]